MIRTQNPADPETIRAVSSITLRARRVVEGFLGGAHASPHFGSSVEFEKHKEYSPGDDLRRMDWRAYARTDRYFVKQQQRQVVLRGILTLDCSASMAYRGERSRCSKLQYAIELFAALAYVLLRQGDEAGLMMFDDAPRAFLAPQRRPDHFGALIAMLAGTRAAESGGTDFEKAIARVAKLVGRRALIVIASDLWGAQKSAEMVITRLSARGHDVAVFNILDPDEIDLPFKATARFCGMEGEGEVEINPALVREHYREKIEAHRQHWTHTCGKAGIDFLTAVTNVPPERVLAEFASRRTAGKRTV